MYTIYADDVCIFDDTSPDSSLHLSDAKLSLSAGEAGKLSMRLSQENAGYETVQRLTSTIRVEREGVTIWMGRVLRERMTFFNEREIECEGALAYLNDTIPMIANPTLSSVLQAHNNKVRADRRIQYSFVSGDKQEIAEAEADGSKSMGIVSSKLVGEFGGVLYMTYPVNEITHKPEPTLRWLSNYLPENGTEQTIEFGKNLLDFTRNWDMSAFSTYCYVRGAEIEGSEPKAYYNSGWQHLSGDPSPADLYGVIETYLDYSDLDSNASCQSAALAYLQNQQFSEMTLDLSAVDLHMIDPSIKPFELLERVRVISWPHALGMDKMFAVTEIEIPLDAPENTSYTLGDANVEYKRRVNKLTKKNKETEKEFDDRIEEQQEFTEQGLSDAKDYADGAASAAQEAAVQTAAEALQAARTEIDATMASLTEGYIFIDTNGTNTQGIYITNSPIHSVSDITSSMKVWKWSMTGLGFSDNGGATWKTAMTYDGKINADMILTGMLMAEYIKLYGDMAVYSASNGAYPAGYLGYGAGHNGYDITNGIHMYIGTNEVIVTESGVRISCGSNQIYVDGNDASVTCDLNILGDLNVYGHIYKVDTSTTPWTRRQID